LLKASIRARLIQSILVYAGLLMIKKLAATGAVVRHYIIELAISREELLKYYRGNANQISVVSVDGQKILFPVTAIQPFVTHQGVFGRFQLKVNSGGRLLSIRSQ